MDDAAGCRALRDKYRELRALRDAYVESGAVAPRERLRALAQRFPGALRELDRMPSDVIDARLGALEDALQRRGPTPDWAPVQLAYHGWLRLALALRAAPPDAPVTQLAAELVQEPGTPDARQLEPALLDAARRPPGGRLTAWVQLRLSEQFQMPLTAIDALLLGATGCVADCNRE